MGGNRKSYGAGVHELVFLFQLCFAKECEKLARGFVV